MSQMEWLRAGVKSDKVGVDREKNIIHGRVAAQEGAFKDERGTFDLKSLKAIVKLGNEAQGGLKARLGHPNLSSDGLGKFLGRDHNFRLDTITKDGAKLNVVRSDLHLDKTAMEDPVGGGQPLGLYVMNLAESDPEAFSSSLVLRKDEELQMEKGKPKLDADGNQLPPLWRPTRLHALDVVDEGAAVDGFLSADGLPDEEVRKGTALLDAAFEGKDREFIAKRLGGFVERYLSHKFPADEASESTATETSKQESQAETPAAAPTVTARELKLRMLEKGLT